MLRARGYGIVDSEDECDVLLLNTCSVRDAAEQKAIGKAGYRCTRSGTIPTLCSGSWAAWRRTGGRSSWTGFPTST